MMWEVLIVEDNAKDCQKILDGLSQVAHCTVAQDGDQAITIYRDWQKEGKRFDFILLDVDMPKQNGFQILKFIRSNEVTQPLESRIIMVTTYKDSLLENYNMGWDDFITKPIEAEILIKRMRALEGTKEENKN